MADFSLQATNIATRMLQVLDEDRSGALSRAELSALQGTAAGAAVRDADLDTYISARDVAHGGDGRLQHSELGPSGLFSAELLTAMLAEASGGTSPAEPPPNFRWADKALVVAARDGLYAVMDADGDGGLSAEELARLSDSDTGAGVLASLDKDHDQRLSQDEMAATGMLSAGNLAATLQKLQPGASGGGEILDLAEWLTRRLDGDGSGDLSREEYAKLYAGAADMPAEPNLLRRSDLNGDGKLSADEVSAGLQGFGGDRIAFGNADPNQLLSEAMRLGDRSGDGGLDANELNAVLGAPGADALLTEFDTDQNGRVGGDELSAALAGQKVYYGVQARIARLRPTADNSAWKWDSGSNGQHALHGLLWRTFDRQVAGLTGETFEQGPLAFREATDASVVLDASALAPTPIPIADAPDYGPSSTVALVDGSEARPLPAVVVGSTATLLDEALDALVPASRADGSTND